MFGKKKQPKMPKRKEVKHGILKAEKNYAEATFEFVNVLFASYDTMLKYIAYHDIQLNEPNREACGKELRERLMPDLQEAIWHLKQLTGMGNLITNTLYNTTNTALAFARVMENMCKTGNFERHGWSDKAKMFDECARQAKDTIRRLLEAYDKTVAPAIKDSVLDDLHHLYVNELNDDMDRMQVAIRHLS